MRIRKWIVILIVLALLITMFLPFLSAGAQGKEGHTIRVALFLDTASYHNTKETVTLTGEDGFTLKDSSGLTISSHNPGEEVRFSPYLYRILVKETGNAGEAQNLVQRVEQAGFSAELMMVTRRGKPLYRVETGQASSLSAAQSLLANLQGKTGLSGEILGMYAWEAGLFAKEAEALARVKAIQDAGFDAHLALLPKNGSDPSYMVLAGNEGTEAELASYSQEFTASLPGISLTPLTHKNYVIKETDSLTGEGEGTGIAHYYYPTGMKIIAEPITGKSPAALTVEEKGNTYRGRMEFSVSNGRLALVNELPLEEYLYGVVGAEMSTGWPMEALKAQAVIARTFAVGRGNKWGIANVVDSTLDQAYYGIKREGTDIIQAVNETSGLVLTYEGKMIEALYSSNTGGMTADGSEVWGNPVPYLRPVSSPDTLPLQKAATWYRIARENGQIGYVHSDYITSTEEKNRIDLPYGVVNTDSLNFRSGPGTSHDVIGKLTYGEYVTILETVKEDNPYAWIGGPADGIELMNAFNSSLGTTQSMPFTQPITSLSVAAKGPSGRVTQVLANGLPVQTKYPDSYRSLFRNVMDSRYDSTKFEIEEMGRYTILGAGGKKVTYPEESHPLTAVGAGGITSEPNRNGDQFILYNKEEKLRVVSKEPVFRLHGYGFGHGLGLSQYGAKALAEQGNDYLEILKHYYSDQVVLTPLR